MEITLPVKALSINKAYRGRRFASADLKQFEKDVGYLLNPPKCPISNEIDVSYTFYVKNYKRADTSNMIKTCEDMLVKCGVIKDDKQVVWLSAEKVKSEKEYIEISILER